MLNKKIILITLIVLMIILSLLTTKLLFVNKDSNSEVQEVATSENLEDLSIQQLTEIRDERIDQNVEYLNNFGKPSKQSLQDRKSEILNSEWGLVSFFNKNYNNLTEKEKLIKQIKLIEYLNSNEDIMYPAGEYFNLSNEECQLSEYLLQNGKDFNIMSYENLKFLINNLEDVSKFIDYDIKEAIDRIYSSINNIDSSIKISQEQKTDLNNELKKISLDNNINIDIKNKIKELQD
ncbi:hypothetical protein [Clostridium sp. CCUG 7971]|uniref:hypothetical protein n=1 Tax=Clostridium sp. CCUG 7971 TaxID=2811414 RepID=UPI001ABA3125|nr:hypothetical protein [Clostridium sp. CCUG 7971]MBO3445747.1 hypothetical protein [Clostridium sp. CCUG 7971]